MYCNQFERYGLLFLSEELIEPEHSNYLKHLKSCHECRDTLKDFQNTWTMIKKIENEIPDSEISKKIINKSRNIGSQRTLVMKMRSNRQISWILGFPSIAIASIFIYYLA